MTLAEQREKLEILVARMLAGNVSEAQWNANPGEHWRLNEARSMIFTISAAGFSIVGPEVTAEMNAAGSEHWPTMIEMPEQMELVFQAMLAAGDLGGKPE